MAWSDVRTQIQLLADDKTFESGGRLYDYLLAWANNIQLEVANYTDIPDHLKTVEGDLTTENHAWYLPDDYLRTSLRFTKVRVDENEVPLIGFEKLDRMDPDHDDISSNTQPDYASIHGGILYVYPKWEGTIAVENYIRKPVELVNDEDLIDLPEQLMANDLIVNGVLAKYCFPHLNEFDQAKFYSDRFDKALLHYELRLKGQWTTWRDRGRYF